MNNLEKMDLSVMPDWASGNPDVKDDEYSGLSCEQYIKVTEKNNIKKRVNAFMESLPEVTRIAVESIDLEHRHYSVFTMRELWSSKKTHSPACVLVGPPGTGKTVAACYEALNMIKVYGIPASYISLPTYAVYLGAGHDSPELWVQVQKWEEQVREPMRVIVFDDLGRERDSQAVNDRVCSMIDDLWKRRAFLIVTTNLQVKEIFARYGEYVGSRLFDQNLTTVVACKGKDNRLRGVE